MAPALEGTEPIAHDEILYRRLPANIDYYDSDSDLPVQWIAFKPNQRDSSGISVWRAKYLTPEDVARMNTRPGKSYYLVAVTAAELRRLGATVVPTPSEGDVGHASVSSLSWERYRGPQKHEVMELAKRIADDGKYEVIGPFPSEACG